MEEPFVFKNDSKESVRLDRFLLAQLAGSEEAEPASRSQLQRWIEYSGARIDAKTVYKPGTPVKPGQTVTFLPQYPDEEEIAPYDFPLDILYEDQDLVVVNKPAGLSVHPGAGNPDRTLLNALVASLRLSPDQFSSRERPGIVHRLDKDTTGILVVAKNAAALAGLSAQFAERSVRRTYQALALSTPRARRPIDQASEGIVESNIGRDPKNRTKMAVLDQGGRRAVTAWRVRERFHYGVLLDVKLQTGRTHQIRVHLESEGSPIVGDPVYGDWSALPPELYRASREFGRQALHAAELGFRHPVSGEFLEFRQPAPQDMRDLVDLFRNWNE